MLTIHSPRPPLGVPRYLTIPFPENWNECTFPELLIISRHLLSQHQGSSAVNRCQIFIQLFKQRFGKALKEKHPYHPIWLHHWRINRTITYLSAQQLGIAQLDCLQWLYDSNTLTNQPFTVVRAPWFVSPRTNTLLVGVPTNQYPIPTNHTLHPPASNFMDITVAQYEDALVFFSLFSQSKEVKFLHMLAKILYSVPPAQYHTMPPSDDPGAFAKIPPEYLFIMYQWFAACHSQLSTTFTKVFSQARTPAKSDNDRPLSTSEAPTDLAAFTKLIHAHAGTELGTITQVRQLLLKAFLFHIQQKPVNP